MTGYTISALKSSCLEKNLDITFLPNINERRSKMDTEKINNIKEGNREMREMQKEFREGVKESIRSDIEELKGAEEQPAGAAAPKKKRSAVRRYFKNLLDMRGDMMSYDDIAAMMDENTIIHGSNMWILMLAIFIASIGLNVNSTAVIIGAMLVSPLMSGIMSMGYSLAVRDLKLLERAAARFGTQVAISLITSTIYFLISPLSEPTSEMIARTSPTIWDVMIALFGGMAGMIGNTRQVKGNVIPGVAIATALMPPLCTVGYGIARLDLRFILGAGYLFLINTLFIALSAALVAVVLRIPNVHKLAPERQKRVNIMVTVITIVAIVPSVYIGAKTVVTSVRSANIDSFISQEFVFSDSQVVASSTDDDEKVINVSVIGEHISDETIAMITNQMEDYGIADYTLRVTQNMLPDFSLTEDSERVTIAVQESKINELNEQLTLKDSELADMRSRIDEMHKSIDNTADSAKIAENASKIFTELKNCTFGYMSKGDDYFPVFIAETDKKIDTEREQTIRNWVLTETGSDKCEMYINQG